MMSVWAYGINLKGHVFAGQCDPKIEVIKMGICRIPQKNCGNIVFLKTARLAFAANVEVRFEFRLSIADTRLCIDMHFVNDRLNSPLVYVKKCLQDCAHSAPGD